MWELILEHVPCWKDKDFSGHSGCVLEYVIESKHMELFEFLLKRRGGYGEGGGSGAGAG